MARVIDYTLVSDLEDSDVFFVETADGPRGATVAKVKDASDRVPEAPENGQPHARMDAAWVVTVRASDLGATAFSNSYDDLDDKPTINNVTFGGALYTDFTAGANATLVDEGDGTVRLDVSSGTAAVDQVSNVAQDVILGRVSTGEGNSEELTPAQVRTLLNVEDGATAGGGGTASNTPIVHGSLDFLTSDADQSLDVSSPASFRLWRTGAGWTDERTITFNGVPVDDGLLIISNNSGQDLLLANGTDSPLDITSLPFRLKVGEAIWLQTNNATSKLIKTLRAWETGSTRVIPFDGVAGARLAKVTDDDFYYSWQTIDDLPTASGVNAATDHVEVSISGNPRKVLLENLPGGSVHSVNGDTGVVVLDADDIDDTSTTNKFVTAAQITDITTALQPTDIATGTITPKIGGIDFNALDAELGLAAEPLTRDFGGAGADVSSTGTFDLNRDDEGVVSEIELYPGEEIQVGVVVTTGDAGFAAHFEMDGVRYDPPSGVSGYGLDFSTAGENLVGILKNEGVETKAVKLVVTAGSGTVEFTTNLTPWGGTVRKDELGGAAGAKATATVAAGDGVVVLADPPSGAMHTLWRFQETGGDFQGQDYTFDVSDAAGVIWRWQHAVGQTTETYRPGTAAERVTVLDNPGVLRVRVRDDDEAGYVDGLNAQLNGSTIDGAVDYSGVETRGDLVSAWEALSEIKSVEVDNQYLVLTAADGGPNSVWTVAGDRAVSASGAPAERVERRYETTPGMDMVPHTLTLEIDDTTAGAATDLGITGFDGTPVAWGSIGSVSDFVTEITASPDVSGAINNGDGTVTLERAASGAVWGLPVIVAEIQQWLVGDGVGGSSPTKTATPGTFSTAIWDFTSVVVKAPAVLPSSPTDGLLWWFAHVFWDDPDFTPKQTAFLALVGSVLRLHLWNIELDVPVSSLPMDDAEHDIVASYNNTNGDARLFVDGLLVGESLANGADAMYWRNAENGWGVAPPRELFGLTTGWPAAVGAELKAWKNKVAETELLSVSSPTSSTGAEMTVLLDNNAANAVSGVNFTIAGAAPNMTGVTLPINTGGVSGLASELSNSPDLTVTSGTDQLTIVGPTGEANVIELLGENPLLAKKLALGSVQERAEGAVATSSTMRIWLDAELAQFVTDAPITVGGAALTPALPPADLPGLISAFDALADVSAAASAGGLTLTSAAPGATGNEFAVTGDYALTRNTTIGAAWIIEMSGEPRPQDDGWVRATLGPFLHNESGPITAEVTGPAGMQYGVEIRWTA